MSNRDTHESIQLDDGEYTFTNSHGGFVRLRSHVTGRYVTLHPLELTEHISRGGAR